MIPAFDVYHCSPSDDLTTSAINGKETTIQPTRKSKDASIILISLFIYTLKNSTIEMSAIALPELFVTASRISRAT